MKKNRKIPYAEPSMETVLLKGSDIIVTSTTDDGEGGKWDDDLPQGGWT